MKHFASPEFWTCYRALPEVIRALADKNFALLKSDLQYPSLHFKKVGRYRSVRVVFTTAHSVSKFQRVFSGSGSAATPSMTS